MLLPCRRGAAFLQLMVDWRICTCVARSNHFPEEVATLYFFSEKFLFSTLEENSNENKPILESVADSPPKHRLPPHRRVGNLEGAQYLSIDSLLWH